MLRVAELNPIVSADGVYRPLVYADQNGGAWDGYIVFFPESPGRVVSTPRETTAPTYAALQAWTMTLDQVYLERALTRALEASSGVLLGSPTDLMDAEAAAAEDAIALHRAAERVGAQASSERAAAEMHEQAATTARANADRLERQQEQLEALADEAVRTTAEVVADAHASAAREARAVAADAAPGTVEKRSTKRARSKQRKRRG